MPRLRRWIGYRRIELISKRRSPVGYRCLVCNCLLKTFDGVHQIAYRLTVQPERLVDQAQRSCDMTTSDRPPSFWFPQRFFVYGTRTIETRD